MLVSLVDLAALVIGSLFVTIGAVAAAAGQSLRDAEIMPTTV